MELPTASYKLSLLLRKLGFNLLLGAMYESNGEVYIYTNIHDKQNHNKGTTEGYCSAPTLALVKMWFEKKYKLVVDAPLCASKTWRYSIGYNMKADFMFVKELSDDFYETYEKALEAGLIKACEKVEKIATKR